MPGYQRKFVGNPPTPPYCCSLCSAQENTEGVEYFIETGVFAEHEGVIYLCSRCFEPLVNLSEKYITLTEHREAIDITNSNYSLMAVEHQEMHNQAELLHELFGLRLSDLTKFMSLTSKLENLQTSVAEMETSREQRSASRLIEEQEIAQRKALLDSLNSQIDVRREELNVFIEASLTTKLERIGRADLISILLNNQFPESVSGTFNSDERETDEDSGESDIPGGVSFSFP